MKKILLLVSILLVFSFVFINAGEKPDEEQIKIVLIHGYADYYQMIMDRYCEENPNVDLVWVPKGGGIVAVDALIAAKEKPNVFMSTPGELGKFLVPGFALELTEEYIPSLSDFKPGSLDIYYREGKLYAIPVTVAVNAFDVNLTLAKRVGFKVPDRDYLTIDEFVTFCQLIKEKAPEGYYGTAIWAGNPGSQTVNFHWLSAFGARFYEDGDYSHTILNSPEAIKGLNFMKWLVDMGYAPFEAPVLDDDEAIAMWGSGKIGGLWARAGGWLGMVDNAIKQGMLDERYDHVFMTWPVADGVESNPLSYGGCSGMVIASGDKEVDLLAARLLDMMTNADAQMRTIAPGAGYVTRHSALEPPQDVWPESALIIMKDYENAKVSDPGFKHYTKIGDLFEKYGGLDIGSSTVYLTPMMQEWLKVFQPFMTGDITAEEALDRFEKNFNKILTEK